MIEPQEVQEKLTQRTIAISRYDERRDYIGLSGICDCPRVIYNRFRYGVPANDKTKLKCYKGYQMEQDLIDRMSDIFGVAFGLDSAVHREIVAHAGRVKGHPDFWLDNNPGECKSVLRDTWIPDGKYLPRRVYWQLQGYMHYSHTSAAWCVYESRENGIIKVWRIDYNHRFGNEIDVKVMGLLDAIERNIEPDCECGRCRNA